MGEVIQFPGGQLPLGVPAQRITTPAPTLPRTPAPPVCWNCAGARGKPVRGERYCTTCQLRGEDSPLVPCKHDGCNTVTKRRLPGQQKFDCGRHGATQEKASFDERTQPGDYPA